MISLEFECHKTFNGGGRKTEEWVLWSGKDEDAHWLGRGSTRLLAIWDAAKGIVSCWCGHHDVTRWRQHNGPLHVTCSRCDKEFKEEVK